MSERQEADLVVVGSGLAGLAAALTGVQLGLDVVVLEKSDKLGGSSSWSYGALWVAGNGDAKAAGLADDPAEAAAYLAHLGGGENDPARTAALLDHAPATLEALNAAGAGFALMPGVNDILYGKAPGAAAAGRTLEPGAMSGAELGAWRDRLRTPPGDEWRVPKSIIARITDRAEADAVVARAVAADQLAQGTAVVARLLLALAARGARVLTGRAVATLTTQGGRVDGVRLIDGTDWRARRGVLLATGGYLRDEALVETLDRLPGYRPWTPETSTGDGLRMAAALGVAVRSTRNNLAIMLGYDDPTDVHALNVGAPSVRELPRAHAIVVNAAGERFGNEGMFQETAPALRAFDPMARKPLNLPCWMVFDAQYLARWGFAGSPAGVAPDWLEPAADLASLALRQGIDPDGLLAAVVRFNGFAERGVDEDFGRKPGWALTPGAGAGPNPSLGAIAEAPFFAVRLFPTLGVGGGGVKADASGRALDWSGAPVPGLYAAGDVAAHDEFGTGYQAGLTFASAMTFARLAVQDMARAAVGEESAHAA